MIKTINTNKSTVMNSLEFNEERQDLKVNFKSGKVYVYTPVSAEFFDKLNSSKSKGRFFNRNVRTNPALTVLKLIQ